MVFTYVEANSNIENTDYLSAIRSALQDTAADAQELSDDEISAQYGATDDADSQQVRNLTAAARLARLLHRRYARQVSFSADGTSVQLLDRAKYWKTVVDDIEAELQAARASDSEDIGPSGILYAGRQSGFNDQLGGSLGGYIV